MEFLKAILGDLYASVEAKVKEHNEKNKDKAVNIVDLSEGKYVSVDKYNALDKEKKDMDGQMKTLNETLETLKKGSGDEELKKQIQKLQDDHKSETERLAAENQTIKFNSAINVALMGAKPKNIKALKALLDLEKIKLDGENLTGLNEQLESIKKDSAYLFEGDVPPGSGFNGGGDPPPAGGTDDAKARAMFGLPPKK